MSQQPNRGKRPADRRTQKLRRMSILTSVVVITLALVFNIAFDALLGNSLKWDWSSDHYYTIGAVSRSILKDLGKNVELIGLFATSDTTSYGDIRMLLKAYEDQGGGRITVRYVDPDKDPAILDQLDPDGFLKPQLNTFVVYCPQTGKAKSVAYGDIFSGAVDDTTGETTITGVVAEQSISGAIRFVTAEKTPLICFTTGHDEDAFDKTHITLATILKNNNYDVQSLDLLGATDIPQDCSAIVMLNPRKDLTAADRNVIGDWLSKGGSLFVMSDFGTVRFPVLNALLADYGVALTTDRIREGNTRYRYQADDAYTVRAIAPKNALTANAVDGWTLVSKARRIEQMTPLATGVTVSPVLTTSAAGVSEFQGKTDQVSLPGTQTIGLMSENTRWVDGITVVRSARVLVFGSASFLGDTMLDSLGTQIYNANIFFDGISWLSGSNVGDALFIEPKQLPSFSVKSSGSGTLVVTAVIVMILLPGLLLLLALRVHRRRRYR